MYGGDQKYVIKKSNYKRVFLNPVGPETISIWQLINTEDQVRKKLRLRSSTDRIINPETLEERTIFQSHLNDWSGTQNRVFRDQCYHLKKQGLMFKKVKIVRNQKIIHNRHNNCTQTMIR